MKKVSTILTLLIFTSIFSQIPSYVPTNGLVGYYPFNGNANDESGNGNNGTLGSGITLAQDRYGVPNKSYNFNGTANITLTSLFTSGSQNFTISGWIKTSSSIGRKGIICWGQDTPNSCAYFFINSLGKLEFDLAYNEGTISSNAINDNIWHYVAMSNNGGLIQLFVDGLPSGLPVSMNPNINGGNKSIGSLIDNSGQYNFIGNIDDLGIWNRALTQQEITNLYNSSLPQTSCLPSYVPTNGLIGYWPFCGNANDESGNGNNGTVTGATLTTDRAQNANSCYNFNINNWTWGAGGDKIYIPFNNSLNTRNITVSAWFMKTSNGTQNQGLTIIKRFEFGYKNPNGQTWGADLDFGNNTSMRTFVMEGSTQNNQQTIIVTGSQIQLNTWYNVVFSFDGQLLKQYLDGVLISLNNSTGFTLNTNGNSGISIGMSDQANGHWSPFGGKIDDIGIWNRALTQQEITGLYNTTNSSECQSLVINTGILSFNPVTYNNTVTIYPNPANDQITIDCGTIANVTGYQIKIVNTLGQEVFSGAMNTQQYVVPLNTWSGTGVYFVKIYDATNNLLNTKKIILQ